MTLPRLLILSWDGPGDSGVGPIWIRDLCSLYPPDHLSVFYRHPAATSHNHSQYAFTTVSCVFPKETGFKMGKFASFTRPLYEIYISRFVRHIVAEAVKLGQRSKVELVLATLHGPIMLKIARKVAQLLHVPLISLIWDPPEENLFNFRLDPLTYRTHLRYFYQTIADSQSCAVMSEEMGILYRQHSKARMTVLHHAIPRSLWATRSASESRASEAYTIGFAGSLYASHEFTSLIDALDTSGWQINGKRVRVRILAGAMPPLRINKPTHIEYLGWRTMQETINYLSETDVLYLPYPISEDNLTKVTFPTKLTTYAAARVPIFYHGSEQAAVARFMERYPVGVRCSTYDISDILSKLVYLLTDFTMRQIAVEAAQRALQEEFDFDIFRRHFADLLGIDQILLALVEA